jgi:hypothetical protein
MSQIDQLNERILERVAHENWNVNQHVDPEVLEDLGYATPETLAGIAHETLRRQRAGENFSIRNLVDAVGAQDLTPQHGQAYVHRSSHKKQAPIVPRGRIRNEKGQVHIDRRTLSAGGKRMADEAPAHIRSQYR